MMELLVGAKEAIEINVRADWGQVYPIIVVSIDFEHLYVQLLDVLHLQVENNFLLRHQPARVAVTELQTNF